MRRNKAFDAATYVFKSGEPFFVDAQVWIYFQPPISQPPPSDKVIYGSVLKNALTAKAQPLIDPIILSEYMYRCCRIEMNAYRNMNSGASAKYKDLHKFRKTPEFAPVASVVSSNAKEILKLCAFRDNPISHKDLEDLLTEFPGGSFDFNDGLFVNTCRQNGWKLLTHDEEITVGGIEVLTANPLLLAACP